MTTKQEKPSNYYCNTCGARFGDDGFACASTCADTADRHADRRAFEVGILKNGARDWHCFHCKIDELSPDTLKELVKMQMSKYEK